MRRVTLTTTVIALIVAAGAIASSAGASTPRPERVGPGSLPSQQVQEQVLDAAYSRMVNDYASFKAAGPNNVVDYEVGKLWSEGIDGAGTTVALMEGWDEPGVGRDLASEDAFLHLPDTPITTIFPSGSHKPPGRCPAFMAKTNDCEAWESEINLDIASVHAMAPYARILIVVTPPTSSEDAASRGAPPQIMQGVEAISARHLANVVSISDGAGETTYSHGRAEVIAQDPGELEAAAAGIPVVASTGDCGPVANLAPDGYQCQRVTARREALTWDDSPWTLAVGGSVPNLSPTGTRLGSDPVWPGEGAGFSSIFPRPDYQSKVARITHSTMRSVPDITMDAENGTSEAAPLMAGILALATQANGDHDIGPINTALYDVLGPRGAADGIEDVVHGNDSLTTPRGKLVARGYAAGKGFDVASGWGTISAPRFVPALVQATRALHEERTARARASADLTALTHAVHIAPARSAGRVQLSATGFLPLTPVDMSIGGQRVTTLDANGQGDVQATIDPTRLHLGPGDHVVRLESMLVTLTAHLSLEARR